MVSRRTFLVTTAGAGVAASAHTVAGGGTAAAAEPPSAGTAARFAHPGLLHTAADLRRMRDAVAARAQPVYDGFQAMAGHPRSSADYAIRNTGQVTTWGRGPSDRMSEAVNDSAAAYQNAVMWAITGDRRHAHKARDILNSWSASLTWITGADGQLGAGLQAFKFLNAAEILRYTDYHDWSDADIAACEESFRTVWYPSISTYALFANGNWDAAALMSIMALGVFCDDTHLFEDAVRYAAHGAGNSRIAHLVATEDGQGQESGRSQAYAQLAIGLLSHAAQVAWNQGVDLFAHEGNRILKGFEYVARYNLGDDGVPFTPHLDRTGKYLKTAIATGNRGQFKPIWEQAYAHYRQRRGIEAPQTRRVIFRGADGSRVVEGSNDDHPSFGTLTHAQEPATPAEPSAPPAMPRALAARASGAAVELSWVAATEPVTGAAATSYTVRRAPRSYGPFRRIARVTEPAFTDRDVASGDPYFYTVSATNAVGESPTSLVTSCMVGLPPRWRATDVGAVAHAGTTQFDGQTFTLEASGQAIGGSADDFHFAHTSLIGDGSVVARVVQPVSSQYAVLGVMLRDSLADDAPHAAMLIQGLPLHVWSGVWSTRAAVGAEATGTGAVAVPPTQRRALTRDAGFPISELGLLPQSATPLPAPYVEGASDGYRLRKPYWVKITRRGDEFTGAISPDGTTWTEVGTSRIPLGRRLYAGLAACSALGVAENWAQTTTVAFDSVAVSGESVAVAPPAPAAPRALATGSAIELTWTSTDVSGLFTVARATSATGPYAVLARQVGPRVHGAEYRYVDATGEPGTTYHYTVAATDGDVRSAPSAPASATMPTPSAPVISGPETLYGTVGLPLGHRVVAASDPHTFAARDLPVGLHIDPVTGLISGTPAAAGEARATLTARNATATAEAHLTISVGAAPPEPWTAGDIGDLVPDEREAGARGAALVRTPGATAYDSARRAFTVRGAGGGLDIIGQGMTAHYAHRPVTGDSVLLARLTERPGARPGDRVALVMTTSLSPFDRMAGLVVTTTGTPGVASQQFVRRPRVAFRLTSVEGPAALGLPLWLRLERSGTLFRASCSADGETWTAVGEGAIDAFGDAPYHCGLLVTSAAPLSLATAVLDDVSVTERTGS